MSLMYSTGNSTPIHCGDLNGKEVHKGRVVWICTADSFHCTLETNTCYTC